MARTLLRPITSLLCFVFLCALYTVNGFFSPTQIAHAEAVSDLLKTKSTGYVSDFAGILNVDEKNDIENLIRANATGIAASGDISATSTYGDEIAVVTIKTLDGDSLEKFANELFRGWGIGQKGKDNGVLVLVAVAERQIRIEVGYGLEGSLTDLQTSQIINGIMKPAFREGKYGAGISEGVVTIIQIINGDTSRVDGLGVAGQTTLGGNKIIEVLKSLFSGGGLIFIFIFFQALFAVLGRTKSWWLGGVFGGIAGILLGALMASILVGTVFTILLVFLGLLFDYVVSKNYKKGGRGGPGGWFAGGGGFGSSGGSSSGGFGGFSGGSSGGGGSSGSW